MSLTEKKELINKYKGQTIQTIYGPSVVESLTSNGEYVVLSEFGEEEYVLSFDDFLSQLN